MESWPKEPTTNCSILYVLWGPRSLDLRGPYLCQCIPQFCHTFLSSIPLIPASNIFIVIITTTIGSTAVVGPWPAQANVASDLYPGQPPSNFYNPVSLRLPLPCESILISAGHVFDLQGLSIISFPVISFHRCARHGPPTSVYWILFQ
jgi:hypothetical protein